MTFSIVAYDPTEKAWGVAVASKFIAVGAVVPHARAGAGAVATQSYARYTFGPDGLTLMGAGKSAPETLELLLGRDEQHGLRQVGMVDAEGRAATYTGDQCYEWAGGRTAEGVACQGNILVGAKVVDALLETFLAAKGELSDRLMAALLAGDDAGGDKRGKQGAALLVVREGAGYGGDNDRYLDVRVDDHPEASRELAKLVKSHHVFFQPPKPDDVLPINEALARELQQMMFKAGHLRREPDSIWDESVRQAFQAFVGNENLEERWSIERTPDHLDRVALAYLRERWGQ
ncbi:MAG TPA: DUF1028 domain-containing protein [Aggregatilineales bacterium]|nr:DUF1028 domain-containing protein [Anaerolineae bacterium]HUN09789.1 DUF1028 domain-containing protein [Aggregatilineales bacterium]